MTTPPMMLAYAFLLGVVLQFHFQRWVDRLLKAREAAKAAPSWALAFYDDGSGLWAVGRDAAEAKAAALAEWHDKTPPEICEEFGDVAWLAGLRLVELRCEARVLREVVLPCIEGARHCPAPWGYPAVGGGR